MSDTRNRAFFNLAVIDGIWHVALDTSQLIDLGINLRDLNLAQTRLGLVRHLMSDPKTKAVVVELNYPPSNTWTDEDAIIVNDICRIESVDIPSKPIYFSVPPNFQENMARMGILDRTFQIGWDWVMLVEIAFGARYKDADSSKAPVAHPDDPAHTVRG